MPAKVQGDLFQPHRSTNNIPINTKLKIDRTETIIEIVFNTGLMKKNKNIVNN